MLTVPYKEKRMLRIQAKSSGRGLYNELTYRPDYPLYDKIVDALKKPGISNEHEALKDKHLFYASWKDPRPGPHADPYLRPYWSSIQYYDTQFGFSDSKQLRDWFADIDNIKDLLTIDFCVVYVKNTRIVHGLRQAMMFEPKKRKLLDVFSIEDLL